MTTSTIHSTDIIKQGPVKVKSDNLLAGILNKWTNKWLVLIRRSSRGALRLAVYTTLNVPGPDSKPERVLELANFTFITRVPTSICKYCIAVSFVDGKLFQFSLDSDAAFDGWFRCLQDTCANCLQLGVAASPQESEYFNVCLLPNAVLNFRGECILQITSNTLKLFDSDIIHQSRLLVSWPLHTIRQFGNPKEDRFTFIAGSSSPTGESMFVFTTTEAHLIHKRIRTVTQARIDEQRIHSRTQLSQLDLLNAPRGRPPRAAMPDMLAATPTYFSTDQYFFQDQWNQQQRTETSAPGRGVSSTRFDPRY